MIPAKILLEIEGKHGVLKGTLSPRIFDLAREMPGRRKWRERELVFELTAQNIEFIHTHIPNAQWSSDLAIRRDQILKLRQTEEEISLSRNDRIDVNRVKEFPFSLPPFDHQLKAFLLSKDIHYFGYFCEMGTGKTRICIDKVCYSYANGTIDTFIILAPNGVHRQWIDEQIPLHMWKGIPYKAEYYQAGNLKRIETCKELLNQKDILRIIAINIETLSYKSGQEFFSHLIYCSRALVAVDESSRIKNISAARTKTVIKEGSKAVERIIMSGTPVTKGVEDLYSQFMFLNPDILGFSSYYSFRNRYCTLQTMQFGGNKSFQKIIGYKNIDELTKKIDGNSYRVLKQDCLDLPQKMYVNRYVEMTSEQVKHYTLLKKVFLTQLDSGEIVDGAMAVTRLIRFQQLLSGHLPNENGKYQPIPTNRVTALLECLEEIQGKVIVWARFIPDIFIITEALKKEDIGFVTYTGATSNDDRAKNLETFKNDPHCKVFVANPQTAGLGLNLVEASHAIWYSMSFSLEEYLQANDRIHRIGQTQKVTYTHLICAGTVDEKITKALSSKQNIATTLLDIREMI